MNMEGEIGAKVVISGTLVFTDAAGEVVKTVDMTMPVELSEEQDNGDQRSE